MTIINSSLPASSTQVCEPKLSTKASKGMTLPSRLHSPLLKTKKQRSDPITQYLQQKKKYRKESSGSEGQLRIKADTGRAYFPTQTCSSKVRVNHDLLKIGSGCESVTAEFRGEVHSFGLSTDGRTQYVHKSTAYLFSYSVQLYSKTSPITFQSQSGSGILVQESESPSSSAGGDAGDFKEWNLISKLPEKVLLEDQGPTAAIPLPSTFRDFYPKGTSSGCNYIAYGWKLTAKMEGMTKKNKRFWLPILVLPLSYKVNDAGVERALEPLPPPTYGAVDDVGGSQIVSDSASRLPEDWTHQKLDSRIKKGLFFSKGKIELKLSFPPASSLLLTASQPFLLQIKVSSNQRSDLLPDSASSVLPQLPLTGAGELHPKLEAVRKDVSKASPHLRRSTLHRPSQSNQTSIALEIDWGAGHLQDGKGVGTGSEVEDSLGKNDGLTNQEVLQLARPWSEPRPVDNLIETTCYPEEKLSPRESTQSDSNSTSTGSSTSFFSKLKSSSKGKEKAQTDSTYETTAALSGLLSTFLTPTISLPSIQTSYSLRLKWKLKGVGNDLEETVRVDWSGLETGIGSEEVSKYNSDSDAMYLSSRALGDRGRALRVGEAEEGGSWEREPEDEDEDQEHREVEDEIEGGVDGLSIDKEDSLPSYGSDPIKL